MDDLDEGRPANRDEKRVLGANELMDEPFLEVVYGRWPILICFNGIGDSWLWNIEIIFSGL